MVVSVIDVFGMNIWIRYFSYCWFTFTGFHLWPHAVQLWSWQACFSSECNDLHCRLGRGECEQPQHPEADLPGPLPAWQCHTRRWALDLVCVSVTVNALWQSCCFALFVSRYVIVRTVKWMLKYAGGQKLFVLGKVAKLFADIQNATSLLNSSEVAPWPNNCYALGCQRDAARAELPWWVLIYSSGKLLLL